MLERAERTEQRSRVHERVEPPELRVERARNIGEVGRFGACEVERKDHRLGQLRGHDFVVQRFELAHDAAVDDDRRASVRAGEGDRLAEAARRAGDEHDAFDERRLQRLERQRSHHLHCRSIGHSL